MSDTLARLASCCTWKRLNDGSVDEALIVENYTVRRVDGATVGVVQTRSGPREVFTVRIDKNKTFIENVFGESLVFLMARDGAAIGAVVRTPLGIRAERPIKATVTLVDADGRREEHCCDAALRGAIAQL